jgi:two-component system, chemotaxis family, response regulator PixG
MVSHRSFQRLQPLNLLAQIINRQVDGCLQIVSGSASWLLYFEQGRLTFATNSIAPFDRLDQHLTRLSSQIPALHQVDLAQLRAQTDTGSGTYAVSSVDYQAIRWLVNQNYLDGSQATALIDALAKEVIEPLLSVTEGMYDLIAKANFIDFPNLCHLDLRPIVEFCHMQLRQRQAATPIATLQTVAPTAPISTGTPVSPLPNPPAAVAPPAPAAPTAASPTQRYTIACIDDSPTVLQAISSFLNDSSVSVVMINDPVKALMQVMRTKPHVILLDVGMPNLDGYELCSLLRRHPSFKQTPIIMVTGHTGFIDRAKAKLVGASGYLTKPFTQSDLVKTVFKHLE